MLTVYLRKLHLVLELWNASVIVPPLPPYMMHIMALSNRNLTIAWGNCGMVCGNWYGVTVVKLFVINCSDSRTVRHAFSQTPIMVQTRAYMIINDLKLSSKFRRLWWCINLWIALHLITCLQNSYYAATYLILITLEILQTILLFPCHEPITIEIASATAGLFCGTFCPLI